MGNVFQTWSLNSSLLNRTDVEHCNHPTSRHARQDNKRRHVHEFQKRDN